MEVLLLAREHFNHIVPKPAKYHYLPIVLNRAETYAVLDHLSGPYRLMAQLLYGSGLLLMECIRLRVKDVEFEPPQLIVRDGKGMKDRLTILLTSLIMPLQAQLHHVRQVHQDERRQGGGSVYLPYALARKYPNAKDEWGWQWVFPSTRRHHVDGSGLQRAVRAASLNPLVATRDGFLR